MQTITQLSAISYLRETKPVIDLDVEKIVGSYAFDDFFKYNSRDLGGDSLITKVELDYCDFYFELKLEIDFDYNSYHFKQTAEYPKESGIEFKITSADVEVLQCGYFNDETDDELTKIINYFKKNITLN
ncbi:MAG: hypothetical protein LBE36_13345 [Flavobacteriaceae bacterium]|jgi:hypothetical protein|nr:hypothetical protein [Flavobacteriaceae bacterium]